MEKRKTYVAPLLTTVEFRTERGYAFSAFEATQQINNLVEQELVMQAAQNDGSGNLVAGYLDGNEDHSNDGSGNWQYANGGWF